MTYPHVKTNCLCWKKASSINGPDEPGIHDRRCGLCGWILLKDLHNEMTHLEGALYHITCIKLLKHEKPSPKLTSPLKIDGWSSSSFPFWVSAICFSGRTGGPAAASQQHLSSPGSPLFLGNMFEDERVWSEQKRQLQQHPKITQTYLFEIPKSLIFLYLQEILHPKNHII